MDEIQQDAPQQGLSRRTVVAGAAWAVPVIAVASAAPMAAAASEPVVATSFGGTATSGNVNQNRFMRVFGLDDDLNEAFFPAGQSFTLTSTGIDFNTVISSITGGTISGSGPWTVTPDSGSTAVQINFNTPTPGTYRIESNGPVGAGDGYSGSISEPV